MDYLAAIRRDSDRFYGVAETADPTRPVPNCPEWKVADLVAHLGQVHWFWATDIEMRAANPEQVEAAKPETPGDYRDLIAWGRAQADRLLGILQATGDDVRVWTWALADTDQTVGFIRRHQVQEAAVHRWDLEAAATGEPQPIEPEVAADSIDEMLPVSLPWSVSEAKPLPGSVHVHCTDTEGEWFIHPDGRVEAIHAKGDAAIRGGASDVLLALYKRRPVDDLVIGDAAVARELLARLGTD